MLEHHNTMSDGTATSVESAKPTISELVNRYHSIGKRSVRSILDMGILFFQAHEELEKAELEEFYQEINLPPKGSTGKKYKAIGAKASLLEAHIDLLPNDWTTIYELTKLEKDQFDRLVQDNLLHPGVTQQAIKDHFKKPNQSAASHVGGSDAPRSQIVAFDFNLVAFPKRGAFAKRLKSLFEEFEVDAGEELFSTLEKFIEQGAAGDA
jgi:hypothetical protein